jgi:desulfoferrodoxin (superoxide reductase-like protein)
MLGGHMPTISFFYGILIRMFFRDTDKHHLPHIHADYQGNVAVFSIETGEVLSGELPRKQTRLIEAWIEIHRDELLADWRLASNGEKIFPIKGLDA